MATWVINTNSNTCHIYDYQKNPGHLDLLKEIQHPENRLKDTDLVSDGPGHYHSRINNRGSYSQSTDPKEHKVDTFAREIAILLKQGKDQNAYEKLVLIAEPHMNGLLFKHLDTHVSQRIVNNIQKDVMFLKHHELLKFLHEHTQYPDA